VGEDDRIRWRCRRGMLELDLVLQRFCDQRLGSLSAQQRVALLALLQLPDNDLWDLVIGRVEPPDASSAEIVGWFR
jgi:antitoxin CptB